MLKPVIQKKNYYLINDGNEHHQLYVKPIKYNELNEDNMICI